MTSVSLPAGAAPPPALPPAAPPAADPRAIRACLTPTLVSEFDREWEIVLERAKQEKDITAIHALLNKWRHLAFTELQEPGSYFRLLAKAEQIERAGHNPSAARIEDMRALIERRLGR
jgi:3,4-dihydroxy-2-butanone 4-phosphate synthase